jgi:DNA-binding NarL/FixJ family response regulator
MRANPTLVTIEAPDESPRSHVDEILRNLVVLIEKVSAPTEDDSFIDNSAEAVLVDTEVDGCRYILLRMSSPNHTRIRLSPREQEIVRMVAKGHPNKVIADVLNISSWTVCTHLRRIFAKLGVGSRAAMVARLSEIGSFTIDHPMRSTQFR